MRSSSEVSAAIYLPNNPEGVSEVVFHPCSWMFSVVIAAFAMHNIYTFICQIVNVVFIVNCDKLR